MPHITTCARCGKAYEETSEETANAPAWCSERLCRKCEKALVDRLGRPVQERMNLVGGDAR